MSAERWVQVEELFHRAMQCEPNERVRVLAAADRDLRREVEALLSASGSASDHLRDIVDVEAGPLTTVDSSGPSAGAVIGPYHLIELIGEGGMGEVWLAEQKQPVRRRVALKLIKTGMNTREIVKRFESERQAVALMDHPAIAKVFDAGSTSHGRPYFVMEYVPGTPITDYCDTHKLTTRERLELFMHVCEGVQHAHQKAIIHRDVKPSNILVSEVHDKPMPRIIDFGVAKAISQPLTAETMLTRAGAIVGTLGYMSPEQADSGGEDIDTRTDVYSLGVVLYELLVGAVPLDCHKLPFDEILRRLREQDAPRPSTKLRSLGPVSTTAAQNRHTDLPTLARQLRGDLDAITLKALEKNRSHRYGSPSELVADIARHLRNDPVLARPATVAYRTRKFARRYRVPLATGAAFILVLIVAAVISIRQGMRANREAAVAQAVNDFVQSDLLAQASTATQSGPGTKPDPDLKVRTALDRAAARIGGKFQRQPEVEAAIRDTIGQTYMDLGLYSEARTQLQRALDLHRRALGTKHPKSLKTMSRLAHVADLQGKYPEAEALFTPTLQIQRRVLSPEHPDTLYSMNALAVVYYDQGKYAQAEALHSQTLEIRRRVLGPEHPDTLSSMTSLAVVYYEEGKYTQAEVLHSQALEIERRLLGPNHRSTLASMSDLADTHAEQGKYAQAEALYTQTVEIERRVLGPEHPDTLCSMNNLASTYADDGKYAQAEALHNRTLEIGRHVLGPEHPVILTFLSDAAFMYLRQGKYALAESYSVQALTGRRRTLGSAHPDTMASAADLALDYVSEGKFTESESLAREAFEFYRKEEPDTWQRFRTESLLGASLAGQQKYAEAEPLLLEGYQGMLARKGRIDIPDWYHLDRAREWLVQLYHAWGKPVKAAEWKRK